MHTKNITYNTTTTTIMPYQSRISALPFEIRAIIHLYALLTITTTIPCCTSLLAVPTQPQQLPRSQQPTTTRRCLRPFSAIAATIDPMGVAYYSPKLAPPAVYIFCTVKCLRGALRMGTAEQRGLVLRERATIRVAMWQGDVDWILEGEEVPMNMVEERPVKGLRWRSEGQGEEISGEGLDGEERLCVVRERMFGGLAGVDKKYKKGEGRMRFWWSGRAGGAGGVELLL